jgi:DNA-binding transcriptional MerR regulator
MSRIPRRSSARPSQPKRQAGAAASSPGQGLKIGDAARIVGEKPFVLRFWETQFPFLRPSHARFKHRVYEPADIENLKLVKRLLHEERFTIEGAKKHLRQFGLERVKAELAGGPARAARTAPAPAAEAAESALRQTLSEVRRELANLHKLLED